MRNLIGFLGCLLLAGCQFDQTFITCMTTPEEKPDREPLHEEMRILKEIRAGTPIDAARKQLQEVGFICMDHEEDGRPYVECSAAEKKDCAYLDGGYSVVAKLYYENGQIGRKAIRIESHFMGPIVWSWYECEDGDEYRDAQGRNWSVKLGKDGGMNITGRFERE
jgi:hypothetical protein